jgi:hypothetical protein
MSFPSNTKPLALAGLLAVATALSGCSDIYFDRRESIAPWSGNAVQQNKVVQMVDPWPPYSSDRNIAFNGEVMQRAQQRYRDGYVIPPGQRDNVASVCQPKAGPDQRRQSGAEGGYVRSQFTAADMGGSAKLSSFAAAVTAANKVVACA